jgi:uncharacterized membrane protein YozB (DUF420 family)
MAPDTVIRRTAWLFVWVCITVVTVFVGVRLTQDLPALVTGELPHPDSFERRYAEHPFLAYAHIVPGVVYLGIAPFQVARRFRRGKLRRHRGLGRVALTAGVVTGLFAIAVGVVFPFGGLAETTASTVFGIYFLTSLGLAYRAVRRRDVDVHRRWMIRAFAIGTGVGTIRLVIGFSQAFGVAFDAVFGLAFWIAFVVHAAAAEGWLARYPTAP